MTQAPLPGWYPDPNDPGQWRWWDGAQWGEHGRDYQANVPQSVASTSVPAAAKDVRTSRGIAIAALITGVLAIATFWIPLLGIGVAIGALVFGALSVRQHRAMGISGIVGGALSAVGSIVLLIVFVSGVSIPSPAESNPQAGNEPIPTAGCEEAFRTADDAEHDLYATHPFHGQEYDDVYADGSVTAEEQEWLDWALADEEAQFEVLIGPVYDTCTGVEDLYASAYALGPDSYWGLVGGDEQLARTSFIVSFCNEQTSRAACSDFNPDDWR